MKRSAEKDLELCEKATKEKWIVLKVTTCCGYCYKVGTEMDVAKGHNGAACLYDDHTSLNETPHEQIEAKAQFIAESREALPYWINDDLKARELLKEIIPAAKFQSCYFNNDKDTDPLFRCCDWSEWIRKVNEFLGGGNE